MSFATPPDSSEILQVLRGISHDMGATHMMLEHSFRRLRSLLETSRAKDIPPEEFESYLSQVEACMRASKGYLDDVTRLSTSGAVEMEPKPVAVAEVVRQILVEQAALIDERAVLVRVGEALPVVWCHPDRLKQVLTNLFRNAVLHGCDPDQPEVSIQSQAKHGGDDSMAGVRIHDNGPGIGPSHRREIFLPGRRLGSASPEGSGWGLPTARRIAEQYGGSLILDPSGLSGTAFILVLPDAAEATGESMEPEPVEAGREWRLQLDARHRGPLRHGHSQHASQVPKTM